MGGKGGAPKRGHGPVTPVRGVVGRASAAARSVELDLTHSLTVTGSRWPLRVCVAWFSLTCMAHLLDLGPRRDGEDEWMDVPVPPPPPGSRKWSGCCPISQGRTDRAIFIRSSS
jgi:hypothetical protein